MSGYEEAGQGQDPGADVGDDGDVPANPLLDEETADARALGGGEFGDGGTEAGLGAGAGDPAAGGAVGGDMGGLDETA